MFDILTKIAIGRDGTVNRNFLSSFIPFTSASPKPKNKVRSSDLNLDSTRNLWIRIFAPSIPHENGENLPLIVYFHGGGFAFMSPATSAVDAWCRRICFEIRAVVISVNYRLAPEFKFPAPYDDGIGVLRFLDSGQIDFESIGILSDFQVDLSSCWLVGDNSGENIVRHMARRWAATIESWDKVFFFLIFLKLFCICTLTIVLSNLNTCFVFPIQPFFGGEKRTDGEIMNQGLPVLKISRTDWFWKSFLPEGSDRNHEAAHLFGLFGTTATELEQAFPPVLLAVGTMTCS
ncbi:hypothetical protein LUZ60_004542 [Juncus effusus]|nr:hypothetical protein LUZ60_004542 [Juncus effusus]